jgi:hypothetical protein
VPDFAAGVPLVPVVAGVSAVAIVPTVDGLFAVDS